MVEIDLEAAGYLFGNAKNCKDYTFLVMLENAKYTKEALSGNPNLVEAKDLLYKSQAIPDESGEGKIDLGPEAEGIKKKAKEKGCGNEVKAMIAVLTTSKPDTKDPSKREADVQKATLKVEGPDIQLKGLVTQVAPDKWVAYHHAVCFVEMKVTGGVTKVTLEVAPASGRLPMITGVWEQAAPGQIGAKKIVAGGVGDNHRPNPNCNFKDHGSWQSLWGKGASRGKVAVSLPKGVESFVVGLYPRQNGTFTFSASAPGVPKKKVSFGFQGKHPHPGD